jgi:hypothetical protein
MGALKPPIFANDGSTWRGLSGRKNEESVWDFLQRDLALLLRCKLDGIRGMGYSLVIAAQPVQNSLFLGRLFLNDLIGWPVRYLIRGRRGPSILTLLQASKASATPEEDSHFVPEDIFPSLLVDGQDAGLDNAGSALVDHFDQLRIRHQCGRSGDRVLSDFEILLAVEKHHGVEVWNEAADIIWSLG